MRVMVAGRPYNNSGGAFQHEGEEEVRFEFTASEVNAVRELLRSVTMDVTKIQVIKIIRGLRASIHPEGFSHLLEAKVLYELVADTM